MRATCDGRAVEVGVTGASDYKVDCTSARTEIALGLEMFGLAYQTLKVPNPAGADKGYVFGSTRATSEPRGLVECACGVTAPIA